MSSRPGVHSLPGNIRRIFSEDFIPYVIEEFGCSATPWQNLDTDLLQGCMNLAYPGLDYVVDKGDALESSVRQPSIPSFCSLRLPLIQANAQVTSFRNSIKSAAVMNVQSFMGKFKTPEHVAEYVKSALIYYGEIPFLYRVFEPTAVRSVKEKGGYKVVSAFSPFQTQRSKAHSHNRLVMDYSSSKRSLTRCSSITESEGSKRTCQRLPHREVILSGCSLSSAPLYEPLNRISIV